jgi:UDP-N-acetylglucosamine transferase subunit ALG13
VARRADLGEHVDDHQQSFARHLGTTGLAVSVETEQEFADVLEQVRTTPADWRVTPSTDAPSGIARIGSLVDDLVWGT